MIWEKGSDVYKIGSSVSPAKRKRHHQTSNPRDLEIACSKHSLGFRQFESFLKNKWAKYRIRGEWFQFDRDTIKQVIEDFEISPDFLLKTFENYLENRKKEPFKTSLQKERIKLDLRISYLDKEIKEILCPYEDFNWMADTIIDENCGKVTPEEIYSLIEKYIKELGIDNPWENNSLLRELSDERQKIFENALDNIARIY